MFCAKCKSIGNTIGFRLQVLCGTSDRPRISLRVFNLHFPRLHVADASLCQARHIVQLQPFYSKKTRRVMSLFKYEQNMFCAKCKSIGNTIGFRLQVLCGTSDRPRISLRVFSLHFPRLHVADSFLCQAISQAEIASMKHQQTLGSVVDMLYRGL